MQDCRARVTWEMRSPKNLHIRQDKDKCLLKKKWPHGIQKAAPPCDIKQTPLRLSKKWLWLALVFSNNCASEQDKQEIYIKQIFQHNMTLYSVVARWRTCWDLIDVIWLYCVSRREFFWSYCSGTHPLCRQEPQVFHCLSTPTLIVTDCHMKTKPFPDSCFKYAICASLASRRKTNLRKFNL